MAQNVQESYRPKQMSASGLVIGANGGALGGFLCTTAGTLQLNYGSTGAGAVIVASFAVTAGVFTPMPFDFAPNEYCYATLGGGAVGTFATL